jgi:isoleucyl-tRNA synthetase
MPVPASCTPRPAMAARTSTSGWTAARDLEARGIDTAIPSPSPMPASTPRTRPGTAKAAPRASSTTRARRATPTKAVIKALIEADMLFARGRLKHTYPHSWRSKKPVIFRNTPQWFVHMDKDAIRRRYDTLRSRALKGIDDTRFVPKAGQNRLRGMIEDRPDWVLSRQRAWGVPITVFADKETARCSSTRPSTSAFRSLRDEEGADAWFAEGAASASSATDYSDPNGPGHRHSRCLVRFRLYPCLLYARRPPRPQMAGRCLSRRLRPAPRLVPFLAAGKLRHARPRAL